MLLQTVMRKLIREVSKETTIYKGRSELPVQGTTDNVNKYLIFTFCVCL